MKIQQYVKPTSIEQAYELLNEKKDNAILGGGAWLKLTNKSVDTLIDISALPLQGISVEDSVIHIGSQTTLHQMETSEILQEYANGILAKAAKSIMGMNVRNIATIGGSIMGKYSFSDIITPLLALDATLIFHHQKPQKLSNYLTTRHPEKDVLVAIELSRKPCTAYFYNVKKTALDFAVINVAVTLGTSVTIAIGARPGGAVHATNAMAYLNALDNVTVEDIEKAALLAQEEIHVSDNFRAQKEYRELLVHVYVKRGLKEVYAL